MPIHFRRLILPFVVIFTLNGCIYDGHVEPTSAAEFYVNADLTRRDTSRQAVSIKLETFALRHGFVKRPPFDIVYIDPVNGKFGSMTMNEYLFNPDMGSNRSAHIITFRFPREIQSQIKIQIFGGQNERNQRFIDQLHSELTREFVAR